MEKKETLWQISLEIEEHLTEVKNDREGITERYEDSIAITEKATLAVREFKKTLSDKNIKSLDDFLNFYLFINMFQLDISVVLHRYLLSLVKYELIFFGKSSALLSYEYMDSIHKVFNKFAKNAPAILLPDIDSIKVVLKQFSEIRKRYPQLQTIRNMIAAHRHKDSFEYLKITSEMDSYVYINLISDLLKINTSLSLIVIESLAKIDTVFKKLRSD